MQMLVKPTSIAQRHSNVICVVVTQELAHPGHLLKEKNRHGRKGIMSSSPAHFLYHILVILVCLICSIISDHHLL